MAQICTGMAVASLCRRCFTAAVTINSDGSSEAAFLNFTLRIAQEDENGSLPDRLSALPNYSRPIKRRRSTMQAGSDRGLCVIPRVQPLRYRPHRWLLDYIDEEMSKTGPCSVVKRRESNVLWTPAPPDSISVR